MPYRKLLHELYQNIPDAFKNYLFEGSSVKSYRKETILSKQGESMTNFFMVESGIIRALYSNGNSSITTEFYFEGEMVTCFIPAYTGEEMMQSLQAITDTTIRCCPIDIFKERLLARPDVRNFFDKIIAVFMFEQQHRSQIFRTSTAIERYDHLLRNYPEYLELIPLKYLASFIDMKRETLSRMRKKMKNSKGIRVKQYPHFEPA
ncbi:MAG: Crp/Fnr family transcriptional regulator [Chitinophagaceae bacterium]|jgi:CRP-like cAMP-binding protein|nr:Crp/Fnr family transcriptional regulator [Chitinophagaceae bacterium]MCU0405060.1 Crp/Fnr family transcriptional regulator [Chitinophagaceae bacterium]